MYILRGLCDDEDRYRFIFVVHIVVFIVNLNVHINLLFLCQPDDCLLKYIVLVILQLELGVFLLSVCLSVNLCFCLMCVSLLWFSVYS